MINRVSQLGLFFTLLVYNTLSYAECQTTSTGQVEIIKTPSISLAEKGVGQTQFAAGLNCTGLGVGLVSTTYLKYRVNNLPKGLVNQRTGEVIKVAYSDLDKNPIAQGKEVDLSRMNLLTLFTGSEGHVQFYATIPAGQTVSPGIYTADSPFTVKWYYSVPALSLIGIGFFHESPGFKRPGLVGQVVWGTGQDSSIRLQLEVLPDCRIQTQDVNFNSAAFADAFEPVKTSMGIRCSAKTPYSVSLNNGLYPRNAQQRAMKSESGQNYLLYEIYKNSTNERWGSGAQRWLSTQATTNPGIHDGLTQQGYAFTVKVLENNSSDLAAGKYQDTVTVQVEF